MTGPTNKRRRAQQLIVVMVAATLALTACGKAAETLSEKAIESQAGGEVSTDGDGSVSFEANDGSASLSIEPGDDGDSATLSGTDDEGNEFSVDVGGTEIPDDFPVPLFEPSSVLGVVATEASAGNAYIVKLAIEESDAERAVAFYKEWMVSQGMQIVAEIDIGYGSILATSDTAALQVNVLDDPVELLLNWSPTG